MFYFLFLISFNNLFWGEMHLIFSKKIKKKRKENLKKIRRKVGKDWTS
jgi:hypothetical protein